MERYCGQYELDSIFQRGTIESNNILLRIWHTITKDGITEKHHHLIERKVLISSEDSI